jgi:hypothetical protein
MNKDFFNDMSSQIEPPNESVAFLLKQARLTDSANKARADRFVMKNMIAVAVSIALIMIGGAVIAFGDFFSDTAVDPGNDTQPPIITSELPQITDTQLTERTTSVFTTDSATPTTQTTPQISYTSPTQPATQSTPAPTTTPTTQTTPAPTTTSTQTTPTTPAPQQISLERAIEIGYAEIANRGYTGTFRESCRGTSQGQEVWELLFRVQGGRLPLVEMYISMETGAVLKWEWDD